MITVGFKQVGVDPGRIPMDQAGFQPCQAAGMQALHARQANMHAWEVVHAQEVCMGGMPGRHAGRGPGAADLHA